jgi:hypothetical protein
MTIETSRVRAVSFLSVLALAVSASTFAPACASRSVDPETLPTELQQPYALFRVRCSKCHTIARPLNAGIRDATHWELYVARMRRVPGSGINEADAREILRFLVYYTEVIRGQAASTGTEPLPLEEGEEIEVTEETSWTPDEGGPAPVPVEEEQPVTDEEVPDGAPQ